MIVADFFGARGIRSTQGAFLTAHPRSRFSIALLLSLLVHALLLSLQFGIRGLGLPGLQVPWEERRALVPALTVRIVGANRKARSSAPSANAGSAPSPAIEKPRVEVRSAPPPIVAEPRTGMTLLQRVDKAPSRTPPREVREPVPESVEQIHKTAAPPRPHHRKLSPAKPRPRIITTKQVTPDAFTVPVAPTDDIKMREWAAEVAEREAQPDDEALAMVREQERLERIRKVEAQKLEQENASRQALELEARRQAEQVAQQQAAQELEEQNLRRERQLEASRLAEESARQQALAMEARRKQEQMAQQQAAQQLDEENLRRTRQIEASKLAEENARQQALEQEARRQEEQAAQQQAAQQLEEQNLRRAQQMEASRRKEENTQRQALALEAQRQAEQLARQQAAQQLEQEHATQQARELEARRQAEQIAQQQATQQLEEENTRRQAEELEARRQAEQMAQQEAARTQEEENAQRARQLEAQNEAQKLADENARRAAADLEARRQGEQAAAQQAAALEGQRQAGERAAAGNAQGQASGQDANAAGTPGFVHVPGSEPTASGSSGTAGTSDSQQHDDTPADADDGPFLLSDSDLASAKVAQVRKVDATRLDSRAAQELTSAQDSRRRTIFGSADDDIVLKMYIDSWRQAIERSGNADHAQPEVRGDAEVTVVIRSDGNVESITVNRADGQRGMDALVRRIAQSSAQHGTFPPDLVRRYDVIEIRRVWRFDDRLTILEEGR
jgi:hypothetical protein